MTYLEELQIARKQRLARMYAAGKGIEQSPDPVCKRIVGVVVPLVDEPLEPEVKEPVKPIDRALQRQLQIERLIQQATELASEIRVTYYPPKPIISMRDIIAAVADFYSLSVPDMVSERRTRALTVPRQIAMYLAKTLTPFSYPRIGRSFNGRDHTTILHAVRKITAAIEEGGQVAAEVEAIKILLLNKFAPRV